MLFFKMVDYKKKIFTFFFFGHAVACGILAPPTRDRTYAHPPNSESVES